MSSNSYLQIKIDEQFAKAHAWIANEARGKDTLKDRFSDFACQVRDFDTDISLQEAQQLMDLMSLLDEHQQTSTSSKYWVLGAMVRRIRDGDKNDSALLSQILTEAVNVSLARVDEKERYPVVAGRKFFDYFACHVEKFTDEAFKLVFDHSRVLTRFTGEEKTSHNLLFDCTSDSFHATFQENHPANHALMCLLQIHVENHEDWFDLDDIVQHVDYRKKHMVLAFAQIQRAHELGVKLHMHVPDVLLVSGLARRLMKVEQNVDNDTPGLFAETAKALLEMATPAGAVPAIADNLFRHPVRPRQEEMGKFIWLEGKYQHGFHRDVTKSLEALQSMNNLSAIEPQVKAFIGHVFFSAVQAQDKLKKSGFNDNGPYLKVWSGWCSELLSGDNPLKGLKATERVVVLNAIQDTPLKRQLLKKYKAERGEVLMDELGL
jgi:hypothetical protein